MYLNQITNIAIAALVGLLLLLVGRELVNWYNKVNYRIKLLEENNRLLRIIAGEAKADTK